MIRTLALGVLSALALSAGAVSAAPTAPEIEDVEFAHEGPFGRFDTLQLQRGLQVFTQVCSACHGLKYVPVRSLSDPGGPQMPEDQVRAYARDILLPVVDPVTGEERPREPTDAFPASQLENAPDLSLITKARAGFAGPYGTGINQLIRGMGGPEYVYGLMMGYRDPPACAPEDFEGYYNTAFVKGAIPESCRDEEGMPTIPGSWIAMPPPIVDDSVAYAAVDGVTPPTDAASISMDVSAFLTWTAEPKLNSRKSAGLTAVIFLGILATLLYLTNKRLWMNVKRRDA